MECKGSLRDTGSLVWKPFQSDGNKVNSISVDSVTGIVNNVSGNPAHISLAATALVKSWYYLENMQAFKYEQSVYVDLGCGTGFALLAAMTKPFHKIIGVELHTKSAGLAWENIEDFLHAERRQVDIQCTDVSVETMNMCDFDFASLRIYSDCEHPCLVLHVDEPLWNIPKPDAHLIYKNTFSAAKHSPYPVLVAYFYCGRFNGDALPALRELGAELLCQCDCDSLNFSSDDRFYMFQLK